MYITKNEKELLESRTFVVFAIETTRMTPPNRGGRIMELGAIKIVDGIITETFNALIKPDLEIPKEAQEFTGITNEMVKDADPYGKVLPAFYQFIQGATLVTHSAPFEWETFLIYFLNKVGIFPDEYVVLDIQELYKKINSKWKRPKLTAICEHYGISLVGYKRALKDAYTITCCFQKMKPELLSLPINEEVSSQLLVVSSPKVVYPTAQTLVTRVKYWEKEGKVKSNQSLNRRLYVSLCTGPIFGTVYFDFTEKAWYNQDFPLQLDFIRVEDLVVRYLGLYDRGQFYAYTG